VSEVLTGACHCGGVRFSVRTATFEALDCNCSICAKKGYVHLIVPREDFELRCGSELLATYTFGTGVAKHTFCKVCGISAFYTPRSHPEGVDVNVRCLDGDAAERFSVAPFDGQNWEKSAPSIQGKKTS